jgi:hypothetical protein
VAKEMWKNKSRRDKRQVLLFGSLTGQGNTADCRLEFGSGDVRQVSSFSFGKSH